MWSIQECGLVFAIFQFFNFSIFKCSLLFFGVSSVCVCSSRHLYQRFLMSTARYSGGIPGTVLFYEFYNDAASVMATRLVFYNFNAVVLENSIFNFSVVLTSTVGFNLDLSKVFYPGEGSVTELASVYTFKTRSYVILF